MLGKRWEILFYIYLSEVWVPLLRKMAGLKSWFSGPQMDSTKEAKLIGEISSFQKVYISQV